MVGLLIWKSKGFSEGVVACFCPLLVEADPQGAATRQGWSKEGTEVFILYGWGIFLFPTCCSFLQRLLQQPQVLVPLDAIEPCLCNRQAA